ncbi:MAG TPA: aldose 1-epimerase family protein [Pseudonocardiaceae bacterium]|jgi:aldose 1-epimerase|nr:aldose 1-epimerase family protein [Pseudonocardiaceae bacterium]
MSAPTGEQFEIKSERGRAVVTEVGAGLRAFDWDGVPYLETFPADASKPPLGAGSVLVPWPNRVAGARWEFDGEPQHLEVTEPDRGNAIHGLTRHQAWRTVLREASRITLATDVAEQPGWPVPLHTSITYAVDDRGLTIEHTVRNVGTEPVPFGVGCHPYPRAGRSARDTCTLQLAAHSVLPLDATTMIPSGPATDVADTVADFRAPRPLAGIQLDTPFGDCRPDADGLVHHRLVGPDGGVELWAEPDFSWVQVFTPDTFPGAGSVIAIEPMTCPPDALNSGVDLIRLAPGENWSGKWGITPLT